MMGTSVRCSSRSSVSPFALPSRHILAALSPDQAASIFAKRPYDLRHGGVSLWLNAGVPATEVAARAGHSVDVLLKVYAKCIDGEGDTFNRRIDDALG